MRILTELLRVVNANKVKCIEVIGRVSPRESMSQKFYDELSGCQIRTDREVELVFRSRHPEKKNYAAFKKRFMERLINTVFFIDLKQPQYSDYQRAYYNCWKKLAAAKILLGKSATDPGINILETILKPAMRYEITELTVEICRILRLHYGSREGDLVKFAKYNRIFKKYEMIQLLENEAEEHFTWLTGKYINRKFDHWDIYEKGIKYYHRLVQEMEHHSSYRLQLVSRLIAVVAMRSIGEYDRVINICQDGLQFFQNRKDPSGQAARLFLHQILICFIQRRDFAAGQQVAKRLEPYLGEGSVNWFSCNHTMLLLALHTQNYQRALNRYLELTGHKQFKGLPQPLLEKFRIDGAYIHYLKVTQNLQVPDRYNYRFRLGKFLNEVPIYSKDKRGMNVPILIIQILFHISNRQYNQAIDRMEAIQKYCYRHLKKGHTFRSNCFIRMLLKIPAASFCRQRAENRAQPLLEKLTKHQPATSGQNYEIEIVPYEDLWRLALDSLAERPRQKQKNCRMND